MAEDSADGAAEQDGGHEAEARTAVGAFEHVDVEPAPHELGPGAIVRGDNLPRGRGRRWALKPGPPEVHDLATPLGIGREHAVINDEVDVGARDECGEFFEELQRLKSNVARPIPPWRLEPHEHVSIGPKGQTVFGDRRPQQIPAEPLELPAVLGTDGGVGMKVEAAKPRLSTTLRRRRLDRYRIAEAKDACPGAGSHGDALTDGRRIERVQRRRLRFIEVVADVVAQQAPSHEQTQDSRSNDTEQGVDFLVRGRFGGCEGKRAVRLSHEDPVDRQRVEVHVQIQRPTKALDDGDRTSAAVTMTRCPGPLPVEALQCTHVDREHRAAEAVIPSKPIAELEGKTQHPLTNRRARENVVDEMRRTLGHPAAAAARAEASTLAGKRDQTISTAPRTPKPGKPVREDAAANESLKLALHEQGGAALVLTSIELPEEGLKVVADDAMEHPLLRRATHVRSSSRLAGGRGAKLHDRRTPSRLVPQSASAFSKCFT